jgi:hypothetical protein
MEAGIKGRNDTLDLVSSSLEEVCLGVCMVVFLGEKGDLNTAVGHHLKC